MPRFTLLQHNVGPHFQRPRDASQSIAVGPVHWDWLFDPPMPASRLWTWATDPLQPPDGTRPGKPNLLIAPALRLEDHRSVYLEFEGEIGGQRGSVRQLATGEYELLENAPECFCIRATILNSRFIARTSSVYVQFSQSRNESNRSPSTPSTWTLRTESGVWDSGRWSNDATL